MEREGLIMKNTWGYIYGDECDELWEHFGMPNRNKNDRIVHQSMWFLK